MTRTVLLVDDEEDIGAALERVLRRDGYKILRATSGYEGLELLAQHDIEVVISDQRMPEMSGVEFLTRVKELYPKTIRMVLSGYADLASVTDAINRGAIYKFLTKPWDNEILCAIVLEAFELYEMQRTKDRLALEIQESNATLANLSLELAGLLESKNQQLERASRHDSLTNLPNRMLFADRLEQELAHARREKMTLAVMFADIDRFKHINDSLGHQTGDIMLKAIAKRFEGHVRASDTVARMDGDEFGFVLPRIRGAQDAGEVAKKILDGFSNDAISAGDDKTYVTASIGISIYPVDGEDAGTLIKNADAALHHAKNEGKSNFQYYAVEMNALAGQRMKLETDLHHALERNEFLLHYQPKVDLTTGKIIGMEALLRWQNPERGLVSPGDFIPMLEETGLILPVGEWVLRAACKQARTWQQLGLHTARIAVNLSALQFRQADLAGIIQAIFREHGLNPDMGVLELELTESILMKNVEGAIATLKRLHELGIHLSIDDFGTGYSSLSYLKQFPITSLKIDQSFVRDLSKGNDDTEIVNAIIALGHSLGLNVIAEGVETVEQLSHLRAMKCDEMQGYLFSRPVPADEMTRLLQCGTSFALSEDA
jgi:diguanylate cyclase (GGDEF)-like protein